ncbi:M3 family metallopeptidase [Roseateles depolymerans]|uniref:oligopeptidase A n=1 Tax=Roseateles depolymerans TaxID=76731 RepID=A0A0U3L3C3_9BURK|nr:M3 family metallopeptidase [Roseateles depolymerans]ALV05822.1 Putative oligopeptidase A [Roseateles depolymerans]REG12906.1 oligopeptidase A [Roseateles depolymerans]
MDANAASPAAVTATVPNPLLSTASLPDFAAIEPGHIQPAISELLNQARQALAEVTDPQAPADYESLSRVLNVATERLGTAWGAVGHLNAVANTPALREAYNAVLPAVTEFYTGLGSNEALYAKYKAIAGSADLTPERRQLLKHAIRDFVLSGAELSGEAKERFAKIQERSAELAQAFSEHVMDATDGWSLFATAQEMQGVPPDVQANARAAAEKDGREGFKLTLHFPVYMPVMQYAEDRSLRERLYRAYVTRASELADKPEFDNSPLMQELLALRQEEARLLGFNNFAEASLVPKMASSPAQVMDFLRDLAARAKPYAQRDLDELKDFAKAALQMPTLQAWDLAYVSEKLKEARYAFSDQEVRQYLTLPRVLEGLFRILDRLFGVQLVPAKASVWHESVQFCELRRDGQLIGQVYLDLFARNGKRPGAWMDEVRSRWNRPDLQSAGAEQIPVAHLVCNFPQGADGKPALLTHDDVITLFHECGHGLHHLLTQVKELGVSGISGVEWDAVELPSQFMENFCWEWEVVQQLSGHVDTGASLPRELFDKMLAAKNFQAGLQTLRQIEFALFDMRLHAEPGSENRIQSLLEEVRAEVSVNPPPEFNRFQHSFSHIFAGGYAAGYYSYKWAEVLSADCWSAFEEEGVFNPETGRRYLDEILSMGSVRDAMDNFKAFRGREPKIDALLRHQGMA